MKTFDPKLSKLMGKNEDEKKPEETPKIVEGESVSLSEAEMEELRLEAKAKVQAEQKKSLKAAFLAKVLEEERTKYKPGRQIVNFTLDLPGHADRIILDGKHFFHGVTYKITEDVYRSMMDIQARAWEHENEIGGANRDLYKGRAPINKIVGPDNPTGVLTEPSRLAPTVKF